MGDSGVFRPFEISLKGYDFTLNYTPKYIPINGHLSRLPHYFRHLFHIVKMIDNADVEDSEKREYAKTLRA
jgi:hypothetical protein